RCSLERRGRATRHVASRRRHLRGRVSFERGDEHSSAARLPPTLQRRRRHGRLGRGGLSGGEAERRDLVKRFKNSVVAVQVRVPLCSYGRRFELKRSMQGRVPPLQVSRRASQSAKHLISCSPFARHQHTRIEDSQKANTL